MFLKFLVIFKVSLSKKFRNNPHGFWLVRSIWSIQIAFYFCYVSTNLKGTITKVFEVFTDGYYKLGPYELETKFDSDTDGAAKDIFLGKFTNYGTKPFFMPQMFIPSLIYILLFITSLLPLSKFKKLIAPLRLGFLVCYHIPFTVFSITTYSTRGATPFTFDIKYSFVFAILTNLLSFIDFFGLFLVRDSALRAFKIENNKPIDRVEKNKSFYFYGNCEFEILGFGLENRMVNRFKKFKKKRVVKKKMEDAGVSFRGSGMTSRSLVGGPK